MINVACNSNGCNALEIMREIYGSGAIGKIREKELQEGGWLHGQLHGAV